MDDLLAEPADQQGVSVGAVEAQHVNGGFAFGRINDLANPQQGCTTGNAQQLRDPGIRGRGIHFLVSVRQFNSEVAFQDRKQRAFP